MLIECPKCQNLVSDQAIKCPNCSFQLKTQNPPPQIERYKRNGNIGIIIIGIVAVLALCSIGYYVYHINTKEYKNQKALRGTGIH